MHSSHNSTGGLRRIAARSLRAGAALLALGASEAVAVAPAPPATTTVTDAALSTGIPSTVPSTAPTWLSDTNKQAPGLSQPASLTPGALPYPTTRSRPWSGSLTQPQYVAPAPAATTKSDAFIISDNPGQHAAAPPQLTTPLAQPKHFTPPAAASPPQEKQRGFWEFILGPSEPKSPPKDPFLALVEGDAQATHPPVPAAAPAKDSQQSAPAAAQSAGASLWDQLLGRNASAPSQPANSRPATAPLSAAAPPAATGSLVSQLVPASAQVEEVITMEFPHGRRPTVHDIEAAKTPATSMTIGKPGMPPSKDVPVYPSTQSMQAGASMPAGAPPVPSVPTGTVTNAVSALWRPFTMTNDAPTAEMPVMAAVTAPIQVATTKLPESERVHSLLQPWYATNPVPANSAASTAAVAASSPQSIPEAVAQSSLGRQLSMSYTDDLRTPMAASIEAQVKKSQEPWDGRVTVEWPLLANPFTMTNTPPQPSYVATAPGPAHQAAFLQEDLPDPSSQGANSDPLVVPGTEDDDEDTAAREKEDERDTLAGARSIGTAPEDTSLDFLRTQTVLLQPGKHQFDIGVEYLITENDFPILITDGGGNVIGVDNVEFKGRELTVPMELRYGLLRRLQGFVQVPVGWANVQAAVDNYDEYENDGGVGDIGFGLTAQLRDAYKDCPYLIGTVAGLAPTGGNPFGVLGTITPNAPSLGNGFWAISGNLLWVQTRYDPVVVFYGFGARYQFEREFFGIEFAPGLEANYTLGTGFAVNERVTLSAQFFGAYIDDLKADGERVEGSNQEPINLRLAATLAKPCNRLVEPFVTFGLTDDAISSNFGITWTY